MPPFRRPRAETVALGRESLFDLRLSPIETLSGASRLNRTGRHRIE